ncbi:MAG TPA: ABC transporter substrate-binding protein [Candidatus Tectomicrobia bacterium]|nr:ABC transporter substrate-binding protein [Candidatus Tectomicrobia bacterium]
MERRRFIVKAGGVLAAAGAAAVVDAPNVIAQQRFQWRMPTFWSPANDVLLGNAQKFAKMVEEMSGGRFKIQVFAAGELMPAAGVFDACSQGTVEMYNAAAYYWPGKEPAVQWFTAMPFGLNPQGTYAWYYFGDGLKLWEETYAPFNLVPRPSASTGPQMMGWFRKKITSTADLKGLKMRIPGLGGKVYAHFGTSVVLLPPGEIYTALERGVLDAAEWVGPHDDLKMGFHQAARFYHYPGWHEPGTTGEFVFNKKAYDALPVEFRRMLDYTTQALNTIEFMEYFTRNAQGLKKLQTEHKGKVEIVKIPDAMIKELKKVALEVVKAESEKSPMAKKVHASYTKFQELTEDWSAISEGSYYSLLA